MPQTHIQLTFNNYLRMKKITFTLMLCIFAITNVFAQFVEQPIKWKSELVKIEENIYELQAQGTISDQKWHIYDLGPYEGGPNPTIFTVETGDKAKLIGKPYIKTKIKKSFDELFEMEIGYCVGNPIIAQKIEILTDTKSEITAIIEWQACDDGSCLPPTDHEFKIMLPAKGGNITDANSTELTAKSEPTTPTKATTAISESAPAESSSIWGVIIQAIIWGFVALLTPCVFPMVPMTVSFFLKSSQAGGASKSKGRFLATFFGVSIIALYTLPIAAIILITYIAGGEAVTADIFNWLATHWVPNILFFVIFMVFAASFFGAFEITMPSWMVNKSDTNSDKGGLLGVFFMALTLVLVSFSCTGPIVGTVLINSTQGAIWEPIITMLAFSTAFALPFTIFAFAPSLLKDLPKSGGWLNSVKVVLGFLEVALGFKFLSVADQVYHWNLLDREVYLAIWIVVFTLLGLYMLGKIRFAHDSPVDYLSVPRLLLSILVFTFVVYMVPGMFGAPLKALSGYLPPMSSQDFIIGQGSASTTTSSSHSNSVIYGDFLHLPHGIEGYFEYNEALAAAKKANKPLFIDFTGHGCVNCREMEAKVWSDPAVLQKLKNDFIIVALYADDKTEVEEKYWVTTSTGRVLKTLGKINSHFAKERFNVNAQPYYAIINPGTEEHLTTPRAYDLDIPGFVKFLENGKNALK